MRKIIMIMIIFLLLLSGCGLEGQDEPGTSEGTTGISETKPSLVETEPTEESEEKLDRYTQGDITYEITEEGIRIIRYIGEAEDYVIPEQINGIPVTILGKDSFYQRTEMKSIVIPESITTIEGGAFYRCYSLETIEIPENVKIIGDNPFYRCISLTQIIVNPNNLNYMDYNGILYSKDQTELYVYPEGKLGSEYIIPNSVKKIVGSAFGYRSQLKRIVIASPTIEMPNGNIFAYPEDITIMSRIGSTGENYALKYGIRFEVLEN